MPDYSKTGPHLGMAVFCERVLEEKDGVQTLVRVVDTVTLTASGPDAAPALPASQFRAFCVIDLKSGAARGRHAVRLTFEKPSGERTPSTELPIEFEPQRGSRLVIELAIDLDQEGLWWCDVELDENQLLTRMPLRVRYVPAPRTS